MKSILEVMARLGTAVSDSANWVIATLLKATISTVGQGLGRILIGIAVVSILERNGISNAYPALQFL